MFESNAEFFNNRSGWYVKALPYGSPDIPYIKSHPFGSVRFKFPLHLFKIFVRFLRICANRIKLEHLNSHWVTWIQGTTCKLIGLQNEQRETLITPDCGGFIWHHGLVKPSNTCHIYQISRTTTDINWQLQPAGEYLHYSSEDIWCGQFTKGKNPFLWKDKTSTEKMHLSN